MEDKAMVLHLAKLAKIKLTDEEISKFSGQIPAILKHVDVLQSVDMDGVKDLSQVNFLENILEKDEVLPSQSSKDELLGCSELGVEMDQISVAKVI